MDTLKANGNPAYIFPASFTYANALCGFFSIFFSINGDFYKAAILIVIALFLDIFDGRIARFFKSTSEFGKELDSFADLISFGVAPAVMIYLSELYVFQTTGILISFLLVLGGMSRLARFNTINISNFFLGIPIDASGMLIASLFIAKVNLSPYMLSFVVIILTILMVSNIKYPSFKKYKSEKRKETILLFILFVLVCIGVAILNIHNLIIVPPDFYILF